MPLTTICSHIPRYHPIYDQFAKGHTAGEPTQTTGQAPHFSNTPNVSQNTSSTTGASLAPSDMSNLQSNQHANRPSPHDDISTASIKSGVIGFPQSSSDTHAARSNNNLFEQKQHGSNQPGAGGDLSGTKPHGSNQPGAGGDLSGTKSGDHGSHLGQGVAAVAGALGAGALAGQASRDQHEPTNYSSAAKPPQMNLQRQESDIPPDSGRSFPLAGGIAHQTPQTATTTSEREPGTKERSVGMHDREGREGLAGAAAAATTSSVIPQNDGRTEANLQPRSVDQPASEHHYGRDAAAAGGLGAAGVGAYAAAKHHESQAVQPSKPSQSAHPEALAAARAAVGQHDSSHDHGGHGHNYKGDPCESEPASEDRKGGLLFTSGPHSTDTANRLDPKLDEKLHIPGEFPSPTPLEESDAPSYLQSKPTTETNPSAFTEPELRHTGTLEEPQARSVEPTASDHHYGRDAAVVGGLGAVGAGAYAAGKHHHEEPKNIDNEPLYSESNPYTSTKVDPRVDTVPRSGFAEQRFDPTSSENRSPRNAALTGGAIGSSQPSAQEVAKGRSMENKEYPLAGQDVKSDSQHHYGRDAALVGAGAATTAGLYASQRQAEPDSGPASSTIGPHKSNVANVLDPRVQPNPDVQKHHYAAPTVEDPAPSTVGPHKSDIANIVDPRVLPDPQKQKAVPKDELSSNQHHHGRDAAVAGGAGAAGYGAYEAAKSYGDHPSTQPGAAMTEQRYDPSAPGAHDPRSTATTTTSVTSPQDQQHHYGRDAAIVGGAGALGAGAYAATRDHSQTQHPSTTQGYQSQAAPQSGTHQRYDSTQISQDDDKDHSKRNAALGTAAGAAAGAGGAYAYSQHDAQKDHERQLKEQQKAFDDQQKALEKKQAHDQKHHDKLVAAEEKKHQKEAEHKEREHAKELDKQQKEHDKLAAARDKEAERHREATPESEEGSPKEKKHRFLTFLNKKDKDKTGSSGENSPRGSRESPRRSKDYAAAGVGAGAAGAAAYEHEDGRHLGEKRGRNVLHKEPPKGHPARDADPHVGSVGKREHVGTDGPIGDPNMISGD